MGNVTKNFTTIDAALYLKDIKKIPIIGQERLLEIFKILKENKDITKKEREGLVNEILVGNLRFVVSTAKKYQYQGIELMDLISEGNLGLLKAIERYNYESGFKFISYAVWWIRHAILSSIDENSRTIRIPTNLIRDSRRERIDIDNFENSEDGYEVSLPKCVDLHRRISEDGSELIETVRDPNEFRPDSGLDGEEENIKDRLKAMLTILDDRERIIIENYYGLNGECVGLEELGEELGCSKERIRQLKDTAIKKLRNKSFQLLKYLSI